MVVCSVYVFIEDIEFLEKLGVKDFKFMINKEIVKLGFVIVNWLIYFIVILIFEKFNE